MSSRRRHLFANVLDITIGANAAHGTDGSTDWADDGSGDDNGLDFGEGRQFGVLVELLD